MRWLKWMSWVMCAGVLMSAVGVEAQTVAADVKHPLEASLLKAIKEYDDAQLHGDRAALGRLVADDYLIVRPRGIGDKASLLQNMAHAGLHLEPFTVLKPFTRNYGTTVVTGGWVELKGVDRGERFSEKLRFADVWAKRRGQWFVVMTTLTPSEAP